MSTSVLLLTILVATAPVLGRRKGLGALKRHFHGFPIIGGFRTRAAGATAMQFREKLLFKSVPPSSVSVRRAGDTLELECEAAGSPSPTIHWLFNDLHLPQGGSTQNEGADFEYTSSPAQMPSIRLGSARGKLYIDCLTPEDEGTYVCVADTPTKRITSKTHVKLAGETDQDAVEKCISERVNRGTNARIYMSTTTRLEYEDRTVQLFCRTEGNPAPSVSWYDPDGQRIKQSKGQYLLLDNGDLVIKDIKWGRNMGAYTCKADNGISSTTASSFLYPTVA